MWGFNHMGHGMFGTGFLGCVIILLIIVLVVFLLGRVFRPDKNIGTDTKDSLKILDDRFARGEISQQEYLKMRDVLERRNGSG